MKTKTMLQTGLLLLTFVFSAKQVMAQTPPDSLKSKSCCQMDQSEKGDGKAMDCKETMKKSEVKADVPATEKPVKSKEPAVSYTCPMHPEVKSEKPGKCPKCGMNLEKKK